MKHSFNFGFTMLIITVLALSYCKDSKVETSPESTSGVSEPGKQSTSGRTYFVNTTSGLHLRDKPSKTGASLELIPDGTPLLIEWDTMHEDNISNTPGYWVKVLNTKTPGYVFSGFISLVNRKKIREQLEKEIHCEVHKTVPIEMGPSPTIYLLKDKTFGYFETELMDGGIGFMGTYSRQGEDILLKGENETKTIYGFQSNYFLDKNHRDQFAKNPKIVEEIDAETKANEESGNTSMENLREIQICN